MTAEERAEKVNAKFQAEIANDQCSALTWMIEQAIIAAVAEEREACARIAEHESMDGLPISNLQIKIASMIRARGN